MRVLVVEDDPKVGRFLQRALQEEGHAADLASDGQEGLRRARTEPYDLLVLDRMLPGRSGLEITRELRDREVTTPILLLTALDAKEDVVAGLDAGADDYLTKPFSLDELLARVRALLRRRAGGREERLVVGDVEMDRLRREARRGTRPLDLTPREFALLEHLLLHAGRVVRRTELLEKVWDLSFDPMSNVVDVHVANLRRKLGAGAPIRTVRGVGYRLEGLGEEG